MMPRCLPGLVPQGPWATHIRHKQRLHHQQQQQQQQQQQCLPQPLRQALLAPSRGPGLTS